MPLATDPRILVDASSRDDAAVFQVAPDRAIVATVLARDAEGAAEKMRLHINEARRSAEDAIAKSADGRLELMP